MLFQLFDFVRIIGHQANTAGSDVGKYVGLLDGIDEVGEEVG